MGPGLITGASDDDPSGIATYSQAGAQFGYSLGWTLLLTYPLMCAIQMISAQVGRVTGKGLAGNMRRHYPALVIYPLIALLLVANIINIGADLGAMAAALRLLVDGPQLIFAPPEGGVVALTSRQFPAPGRCRTTQYLRGSLGRPGRPGLTTFNAFHRID